MRASIMKKPLFVCTADIHVRVTNPAHRKDNYFQAMEKKLLFIKDYVEKNNCLWLDAGDLFDSWKSSPKAESLLFKTLPEQIISVAGNHEIPYHNVSKLEDSSFHVMQSAGRVVSGCDVEFDTEIGDVYCLPYGSDLNRKIVCDAKKKNIMIYHGMVWKGKKPDIPGIEGYSAKQIIAMQPEFDIIITGHNHDHFIVKQGKTTLINPGSLMRSSIIQLDYEPVLPIVYDDCSVELVKIPIEKDVFDLEKYESKKQHESRMNTFIDSLVDTKGFTIDFAKNVQQYINTNKTKVDVVNEINQALGGKCYE
jgi:predicted phosphodiesterase